MKSLVRIRCGCFNISNCLLLPPSSCPHTGRNSSGYQLTPDAFKTFICSLPSIRTELGNELDALGFGETFRAYCRWKRRLPQDLKRFAPNIRCEPCMHILQTWLTLFVQSVMCRKKLASRALSPTKRGYPTCSFPSVL